MSVPRSYRPLAAGQPAVGQPCGICGKSMAVGDVPTLLPGAPADEEQSQRMAEGRPYTSFGVVAHWACWERERAG